MARITRTIFNAALEAGVTAFIGALNEALAAADERPPEQQALLPEVERHPARELIALYINEFKKRYGERARPNLDGKSQAVIKRLLRTYTQPQVGRLIQVYLSMDDEWFAKKVYDLVTLEVNLQRVLLKATTGQDGGRRRGTEEALAERGSIHELDGPPDSA